MLKYVLLTMYRSIHIIIILIMIYVIQFSFIIFRTTFTFVTTQQYYILYGRKVVIYQIQYSSLLNIFDILFKLF